MSNIKKFRIKSFKDKNHILSIEKLSFKFGKKIILDNLSLRLSKGQILGVLGPNGAGKSTIFNLIIGLLSPDFGSIKIFSNEINQYPIYERSRLYKIGYVPQYGGYFNNLTVFDNLRAIAEIKIKNSSLRNEKINSMISRFELDQIGDTRAELLSGGQKKKLVIALTLISDPQILLLDEPFAALDVMTIKNLQKTIVDLQFNNNISIILCDHQARDLLACVDVAAIIHNGKVIAQDTPNKLIQNTNARNFYFGDTFKIN
jgi:lipopolysaccharide export system ATP-binding protein